jgi:hypothetical protein
LNLILEYYHDFKIIIRLDTPLMGEVFFLADRVFAGLMELMELRGSLWLMVLAGEAVMTATPDAVAREEARATTGSPAPRR